MDQKNPQTIGESVFLIDQTGIHNFPAAQLGLPRHMFPQHYTPQITSTSLHDSINSFPWSNSLRSTSRSMDESDSVSNLNLKSQRAIDHTSTSSFSDAQDRKRSSNRKASARAREKKKQRERELRESIEHLQQENTIL